ncbi:hypothetical protein CONPUDRAFT_75796 [Coniophora puteana RWD-64-598 SS2]|uniref:Uncharacterized protein n=1 Tax=Coniophora puteana (strain RWD-64-598) TaxID=741705 RepID=A0A5M3MH15_CONPW|nr:uncharacterized protein CONPUDRAFT_75796 [Coniophora puteana RWD-64-598 SS2]EIW78064.1 hypothetical protein CONPUDRAFT_75796 [Coniophora puteana RWD-64-598 SS2]
MVRAGCCMHKDLNCVKGGNTAMMAYWEKAGVKGPIPLPNRDNAAVLRDVEGDEELTEAQLRAVNVTTCGAVKTTNLAGALFNHKDDKKGLQDIHRQFMEQIVETGEATTFPDTSNTRYGSHCEAAAWLITWRQEYRKLLEEVRDNKQKANFSHLEANLYASLDDIPTLTELAVLTLYGNAISSPYMRSVRGSPDINILDLGPFHAQVVQHIKDLIKNVNFLLYPGHSAQATLDGAEWDKPRAIAAVQSSAGTLPHLSGTLTAFLQGALSAWERFSSEFHEDGDIASLSAIERENAWMPATNDVNEGALGAMRVHQIKNPSATMLQFNALTTYKRNDTHAFMQTFTPSQHLFVKEKARQLDSAGIEKKRRRELVEHKAHLAAVNRQRQEKSAQTRKNKKNRLDALELILDERKLETLTGPQLGDQWDLHRRRNEGLPAKSNLGNKANYLLAVKEQVKALREGDQHDDPLSVRA